MRIFSYVITHDTGFAPNPFGPFLTLATCKPRIRASARKGDFLVGTGSALTVGNNKLVYAAEVARVISLEEYGVLPRYACKRASTGGEWWRRHGDNIYCKVDGKWRQRRNVHHNEDNMDRDLIGSNVLICRRFWYFGDAAIEIPAEFREIIKKGPGHKIVDDEVLARRFVEWLTTMPRGRDGTPLGARPRDKTCGKTPNRVGSRTRHRHLPSVGREC